VLNKFAIVPGHFILATKEFKPQGWLLEEGDLVAGVGCLGVYYSFSSSSSSSAVSASSASAAVVAGMARGKGREGLRGGEGGVGGGRVGIGGVEEVGGGGDVVEGGERGEEQEKGEDQEKEKLFIFFNSGVHSGASQPHRHLQLLPVDAMREGLEEIAADDSREGDEGKQKWEVAASLLVDDGDSRNSAKGDDKQSRERGIQLPFRTFAERIHVGMDGAALRAVYLRLYRQACQAMGVGDDEILDEGEARISYNLAMTSRVMVLAPRVAEGAELTKDGEVVGKLALNGTVLAGTGLVKTQAEWDALRQDPDQVARVLRSIGLPAQSGRVSSETKI